MQIFIQSIDFGAWIPVLDDSNAPTKVVDGKEFPLEWEEMTEVDRFLVGLLLDKEEYKREEVLKLMGARSGNYSMYRDRLLKRGILEGRQAYISLALPFFADYVKEYC